MLHRYVSLGAACDAAMMLDRMGLRPNSLPFDWLWNLDGGLAEVNAILDADFATVVGPDAYAKRAHRRFDEPMVVYARHPNIVHLHSDPLTDPDAAAELSRRTDRFRALIASDAFLHFVAYEVVENDGSRIDLSSRRRLERLVEEGLRLLSRIDAAGGPSHRRRLLLVLQSGPAEADVVRAVIADAASPDPRITFGFTLARDDGDDLAKARWRRQWAWLLMMRTAMPPLRRLRCGRRFVSALGEELRLSIRRRLAARRD